MGAELSREELISYLMNVCDAVTNTDRILHQAVEYMRSTGCKDDYEKMYEGLVDAWDDATTAKIKISALILRLNADGEGEVNNEEIAH